MQYNFISSLFSATSDGLSFLLNITGNIFPLILFLPPVVIALIWIFNFKGNKFIHKLSLLSSSFLFILSLYFWATLVNVDANFQHIFSLALVPSFEFSLVFGVDGISIYFILLTNLFIYLCILSLSASQNRLNEILMFLFFLQWGIVCAFSVLDLLGFFIFFEATLIPIYFIVLVWGSRERKIRASYLISIYTLLGSIFMFFNIIYILSKTGCSNYLYLLDVDFNNS